MNIFHHSWRASGPLRGPLESNQKQSEAEAEQKREEADLLAKHQQEFENSPMQLYFLDLARDPDFYRRQPAPARMRREFLERRDKKALDAAHAVWLERFDCQLPEVMTHDQCNQALRIEYELLK
jgi:hypothetical protein